MGSTLCKINLQCGLCHVPKISLHWQIHSFSQKIDKNKHTHINQIRVGTVKDRGNYVFRPFCALSPAFYIHYDPSHLHNDSILLSLSLSPLVKPATMLCCPMKRPLWQEIEGGCQPTARDKLRSSVQHPARNQIPPSITEQAGEGTLTQVSLERAAAVGTP